LIGVKVRERLPDSVLAEADQIINIDLSAEDLQQRLREGKIYPKERIQSSLENFFTNSNLEHLRELALRELASQIDFKRRETGQEKIAEKTEGSPDQVMVCLSSRGPNSARLLRFASRLAGRINRNWYAVYIQTPSEDPTLIDATTQRLLADTQDLAKQLGATVFTWKGTNVADSILRFASEYGVGQVVIGRPHSLPWWKRLMGQRSVAEDLIHRANGVSIIVVDADSEERRSTDFVEPSANATMAAVRPAGTLSRLLTPQRIIIWDDPASRQEVRKRLVDSIVSTTQGLSEEMVMKKLAEREQLGSTFLNEGIALPHARLEGLETPQVALGLTRAGLLDVVTEQPVSAVFLLLSPSTGANVHLQLLAKAGRALQNRELRQTLSRVSSPEEAMEAIQDFESAFSGQPVAVK
jgi:two-component system sensor histidine kinase KdpD